MFNLDPCTSVSGCEAFSDLLREVPEESDVVGGSKRTAGLAGTRGQRVKEHMESCSQRPEVMREVTATITAESWVVVVENDDSKLAFAKIGGRFYLDPVLHASWLGLGGFRQRIILGQPTS